jgi:hypothetical protein
MKPTLIIGAYFRVDDEIGGFRDLSSSWHTRLSIGWEIYLWI